MNLKTAALVLALLPGSALAMGAMVPPPTAEQMAAVRAGMTTAEVEQVLGKPTGRTETYKHETVSGWMLTPRGRARTDYFNVHYQEGKVARISRSTDYRD